LPPVAHNRWLSRFKIPNRSVDLITNRSMPEASVIPQLAYRDVGEAVDWLCNAFGFKLRLRVANHRAQLDVGNGAVILVEADDLPVHLLASFGSPLSVMVRVEDVDRCYERASRAGAVILGPLSDYPYGERQYSCRDPGGYTWTFSQTIADVAPGAWGGSGV
jgi:uncharacterized glyoxalase superfamily protein PhnB